MNKIKVLSLLIGVIMVISACSQDAEKLTVQTMNETKSKEEAKMKNTNTEQGIKENVSSQLIPPANSPLPDNPNLNVTFNKDDLRDIYLAGGCFWGVEAFMSRVYGVYDVTSGFANGKTTEPTYKDVVNGSGHAETVHVRYDPNLVTLEEMLDKFFEVVDPTSLNKQGNDVGVSYRSGIYYTDEKDLPAIEKIIDKLDSVYKKDIVVEVAPLDAYFLAEDYHQDYLEKNPNGYCHIEFDSLEDQSNPVSSLYKKPSDNEIRAKLSDLQYDVTQNEATERSFDNEYWDNKEEGIYVDIVSGEPLYSSSAKYKSGTGWPSFYEPISEAFIQLKDDNKLFSRRTEVRSTYGDSHLGHVFSDGPKEHGGLRYCMNSAAMKFIPYDEMEAEGYGAYMSAVK